MIKHKSKSKNRSQKSEDRNETESFFGRTEIKSVAPPMAFWKSVLCALDRERKKVYTYVNC